MNKVLSVNRLFALYINQVVPAKRSINERLTSIYGKGNGMDLPTVALQSTSQSQSTYYVPPYLRYYI